MSLSITALADELQDLIRWQQTPQEITTQDYIEFIKYGVKKLFVDTGRASLYHKDMFVDDQENNDIVIEREFLIDEQQYILIVAQIRFFQKVANDVNRMMGYSTNALTVTNADKPYANISDTISKLENQRRITYYKMCRFTL